MTLTYTITRIGRNGDPVFRSCDLWRLQRSGGIRAAGQYPVFPVS